MRTISFFIATILFSLISVAGLAQEVQKQPFMIGVASQNGFIIAHTPIVRHLAASHPAGAELNMQWQTNGSKPWHHHYNFPKVGVSFIWYDYHNPILGNSYAISPYVNKTFRRRENSEINFRMGTGIAVFSKKFDLHENHKNSIISSRINAVIQFRLEYLRMISERVSVIGTLGLNHYSNGATSKPNMGINIPTIGLGVNYHTNRQPLPERKHPEILTNKEIFFNVSTSVGIKQLVAVQNTKYWVNNISLAVGKQLNHKNNILFGVDGFYDRSIAAYQLLDTALTDKPFPDTKRAGIFIGHELLFGKVALESQLAVYIYRPYKIDTFYYERIGLKYHITDKIYSGINLKVHRGSADVIEFRIGAKL